MSRTELNHLFGVLSCIVEDIRFDVTSDAYCSLLAQLFLLRDLSKIEKGLSKYPLEVVLEGVALKLRSMISSTEVWLAPNRILQ